MYKEKDNVAIALFIGLLIMVTTSLMFVLYINNSVKNYEREIEQKEEIRVHQLLADKQEDINNNHYTYNELMFDIVQGNAYMLEDKRGRFIDMDKYREGSPLYDSLIKAYVRENVDRNSTMYREVFQIPDDK